MNIDGVKPRRYRGSMSDVDTQLLTKIASELAVKFSDLARMFSDQDSSQLRERLQRMQDAGLVSSRELPGSTAEEAVWSITADGSKKAESTRAFAAWR